MRFTKQDILEGFEREERSYRLALLCSNWIRDAARYKPSAAEDAAGLRMESRSQWVSFQDLADILSDSSKREVASSHFVLNQLYTLIRTPFELLSDYCQDFEQAAPERALLAALKAADWYWFAKTVRNAVSHNYHFHFEDWDRKRLPISWNGITLTEDLHGKPLTYESFWHKTGYELFLQMRDFARALPERSCS